MQTAPRFARITDEALNELRSRIGQPVRLPQPWIEEATKDAIRHYALGIGDPNPLWVDERYARGTRHGDLLAPPTILYAADRIVGGYVGGLPGVHAMFAGTDWHWQRPVRRGDRFRVQAWLKALDEKQGAFAGRTVKQVYRVEFRDGDGAPLATADSWCIRTERDAARDHGKYEAIAPHQWTADDIREIAGTYAREQPRGGTPRYWEGVQPGDALGERLKGPFTPTGSIAYVQGWGGLYVAANRVAFEQFDRHPALGIPNGVGVPEPPERVHWDHDLARMVGVPAAFDYGPERVSWMGHLVTDWMGDDGFLADLSVEVRRHNIMGDLTRCRGRVTGKRIEEGRHLVDCAVWGENQRGEITTTGQATVMLPSRA